MKEKIENLPKSAIEKGIDWSDTLHKYEIPTVFKDEILRPYFEGADIKEPVLDAGCGKGYFSQILCKRGFKVSGIDLNSQLESNEQFDFQKGDFTTLETDKRYKTILLINILTTASFADRIKILKKIKEVKTEDGIAYVVNTNADLFGSEIDTETLSIHKVDENKFRLKIKLVNGEHIEFDDYIISQEEMEEMCKEAGLEIIKKEDLNSKEQEKSIYEIYTLK